jgi:hypothetical protein
MIMLKSIVVETMMVILTDYIDILNFRILFSILHYEKIKMSRRLPVLEKEKAREAVENIEMKREETVWRRWMLKEGAIIAEQKVSLDTC